jgi:multidrug efflux pump subunit AcrA (membrane-fusion protein)
LKINDYKAANATVIPVNFIQTDPNGSFVYVAENKGKEVVAKKAFVKQGQSYDGMIEITEGLKPGDKVISTNYLELEEGEVVKL